MQKWEYHVVARQLHNREWKWADPNEKRNGAEVLSDLGKQGWELVTVLPVLEARSINLHQSIVQARISTEPQLPCCTTYSRDQVSATGHSGPTSVRHHKDRQ